MKFIKDFGLVTCCFLTLLPLSNIAHARPHLPSEVKRQLRLAHIPINAVTIFVQNVNARHPKLDIHGTQLMSPASTIKLLTTFVALDTLGPDYTWRTEAYISGNINQGILDGNLLIRGSGDPKLSLESFGALLRDIHLKGINTIHGNLILDRTLFNPGPHDPGAFDQHPLEPYNVGPDALLVNLNTTRLDLVPDAEHGSVYIAIDPSPFNLKLINQIKLTPGSCNDDWEDALHAETTQTSDITSLLLTGNYAAECGKHSWYLAPLNHDAYIQGVFQQLWKESGGNLSGTTEIAPLQNTMHLIAQHDSPPLSEIIRDINKFSNNTMAEQVFLTLGTQNSSASSNADMATQAIYTWLASHNLSMPGLILENGSGLSRKTRINAESMGKLLISAWHSAFMPEFTSSLPIAGLDGTLRRRLKTLGASGFIRGKTGSMDGVRALAGYITDRRKHTYAFVFMVNHSNAALSKAAQDALMTCLYEHNC